MLKGFCRSVDTINAWLGKWAGFLVVPLVALVTMEVILRYAFNRPTIWAWDVNIQLLAAMVVVAAGFTLLRHGHTAVDVLVIGLSPRARAIVDLITGLFFLFGVGVVVWKAAFAAWDSLLTKEVYSSYFAPPVYPLKIIMAAAYLLLLLQGIVKFIRDLNTVLYPRKKGEL